MTNRKIGIIGSGLVGQTLATSLTAKGYDVTIGTSHPEKLREWALANEKVKIGGFKDAADFGELIILSVKGTAAEDVVRSVSKLLSGKTVIDTCNPIADLPPTNGVMKFFTSLDDSLMERLQDISPEANFVKSFNTVGSFLMVNPELPGGKPTMFICGNSDDAKKETAKILSTLGWDAEDSGKAESARAIEPLCILWGIRGLLNGQWAHAFKLLKYNS